MNKWILLSSLLLSLNTHAAPAPQKDILFVIDNSGSMSSSQTKLVSDMNAFIQVLNNRFIDYNVGVTTTDAYLAAYNRSGATSELRDGSQCLSTKSGYKIVNPATPQGANMLAMNLNQGVCGSGDERALQSFEQTLMNPLNANFRRANADLIVILLSDEDDFSHDGEDLTEDYNDPRLTPVDHFQEVLKTLAGGKKAQFHNIGILDPACAAQLNTGKISVRTKALADATGGLNLSLCDDFVPSLIDAVTKQL